MCVCVCMCVCVYVCVCDTSNVRIQSQRVHNRNMRLAVGGSHRGRGEYRRGRRPGALWRPPARGHRAAQVAVEATAVAAGEEARGGVGQSRGGAAGCGG